MAKRIRWDRHPSITLVNGKPKLKIFEEYFVEEDLPKFKRLLAKPGGGDDSKAAAEDIMALESSAIVPGWHTGEGVALRETDLQAANAAKWNRNRYVALKAGRMTSGEKGGNSPFMSAVRSTAAWLKRLVSRKEMPISVEDAFGLAKDREIVVTTEELLRSRAIAGALIRRFEETCQFAMAKKVRDHLDVLAAKLALAQRGMCRYLTEDQAIEFMTKAERGVQVEFLRYYPEVIPADIGAKIAECNLALLFDNYVVMYYSTNVDPVRLLEEEVDERERHRRRDPILFGTLRGSRELYYVADWVYKDDDLTLETVEKAIGTIPTIEDERIEDSQFKLAELLHEVKESVDRELAEARDTGRLLSLEPDTATMVAAEQAAQAGMPDGGAQTKARRDAAKKARKRNRR